MPEGLLNRGKYCGKSRLRQRKEEFGYETKSLYSNLTVGEKVNNLNKPHASNPAQGHRYT